MDPKGYEKKPWFPYVKNMYDEIEGDMMEVDAKGYEEKPWWPYVLDLQEKIDTGGGGGGGSSDFSVAEVTLVNSASETLMAINAPLAFEENALGEGAPPASFPVMNSSVESGGTLTLKVILYKGNGVIDLASNSSNFVISLSDDIESIGAEMALVHVHGNGTITFSNKPK